MRLISGGLLLQDADRFPDDIESVATDWELVSGERPEADAMTNLIFAWKTCRAVKSNAIVLAKDSATVGIGMGQVNRVDSCRLAVERAGDRVQGAVAASDAFFPFADGPQVLIDAGVSAIVQPGGSVRDEEVVKAATGDDFEFNHFPSSGLGGEREEIEGLQLGTIEATGTPSLVTTYVSPSCTPRSTFALLLRISRWLMVGIPRMYQP